MQPKKGGKKLADIDQEGGLLQVIVLRKFSNVEIKGICYLGQVRRSEAYTLLVMLLQMAARLMQVHQHNLLPMPVCSVVVHLRL